MKNITQLLTGTKVLAEAESKFNGQMRVISDYAWGTYIQADGLTQSGGVVEKIWRTMFKKAAKDYSIFSDVLILGLGGGTVAKLVRKSYPKAAITGVDIDPTIIKWGEEYLGLKEMEVETLVEDANHFADQQIKASQLYDLIIIDIYQGRFVPQIFTTAEFVNKISLLLEEDGLTIFNRLYYGEKRPEAMRFLKTLEKVFPTVDPLYPEANIMFFCRKI